MATPALAADLVPLVKTGEAMSRHTSWHVGGPAQMYFTPRDRRDLARFLAALPPTVPVHWLGLGSNLLVRDGGLRGAVIATHNALGALERRDAATVYCEAGVPCARIAKQCVKWGLGPAEFFSGIPGTLGGALAMNAGAFGGETWNHVVSVEVIGRDGAEHTREANAYAVGYRSVRAPAEGEGFLAALLRFGRHPAAHADEIRALLEKRKLSQPIGEWSGGSTFTNPPGDHAARLIEAAGLKGHRIGGASVSTKHANFIINHGDATAADIEALLRHVQAAVRSHAGVELHPEVRIVGETTS